LEATANAPLKKTATTPLETTARPPLKQSAFAPLEKTALAPLEHAPRCLEGDGHPDRSSKRNRNGCSVRERERQIIISRERTGQGDRERKFEMRE